MPYLTLADYFLKPQKIMEQVDQLPEAHPSLAGLPLENFPGSNRIRINANGAAIYTWPALVVIGSCLPLNRLCVAEQHKNHGYATEMLQRWFIANISYRPGHHPPPRNAAGQRVYEKVWLKMIDDGRLIGDELNGGAWYGDEPPIR